MIVAALIVIAMAAMAAFPEAPVSRLLHRWLVDPLAAWIAGFSLRRFVLSTLMLLGVLLVLAVAPEAAAMFFALGADAAAMEILFVLWLAATTGNLRGLWRRTLALASVLARLARATVVLARRALPRPRRRRLGDKPPRRPDDSRPEPGFAGLRDRAFA